MLDKPRESRSIWWKLRVIMRHPYHVGLLKWWLRGNKRIVYTGIINGQQSYAIVPRVEEVSDAKP